MTDTNPVGTKSLEERFWAKVDRRDGCWLWRGHISRQGYGYFYIPGQRFRPRAHRWLFERYVGPILAHLDIHHICNNPPCVRPSHLQILTRKKHLRLGDTLAAANARKTHCPRGHAYNTENTSNRKDGKRKCRICEASQARERRRRRRESSRE